MAPIRITDPTVQITFKGSYKFPTTIAGLGNIFFSRRRGFTIDQATGNVLISTSQGAAYTINVTEFTPPTPLVNETARLAANPGPFPVATYVGNRELLSGNPSPTLNSSLSPQLFMEGMALARKADVGLPGAGNVLVCSGRYNYSVSGPSAASLYFFDHPFTTPIGGVGPCNLNGWHVNALGITCYVPFDEPRLGNRRFLTGCWYAQGSANSSPHPATCAAWNVPNPLPSPGSAISALTLCRETLILDPVTGDPVITYPTLPGQLPSYIPRQGGMLPVMTHDCQFWGAAVYDVPADANSPGTRGYIRIARAGSCNLYCGPTFNGTNDLSDCLRPDKAEGLLPPGGYCNTQKGYHNEPHTPLFLFYDLDDFDRVRLGTLAPDAVRHHAYYLPDKQNGSSPIGWWNSCHHNAMGCAYHYATRRLHVSQQACYSDSSGTYPIVHVYEFSNSGGAPPPPPPPPPSVTTRAYRVRHRRRRVN